MILEKIPNNHRKPKDTKQGKIHFSGQFFLLQQNIRPHHISKIVISTINLPASIQAFQRDPNYLGLSFKQQNRIIKPLKAKYLRES